MGRDADISDLDLEVADTSPHACVCLACLERERALRAVVRERVTVTSCIVPGRSMPWTVFAKREGDGRMGVGRGDTEEEALFLALSEIGVLA